MQEKAVKSRYHAKRMLRKGYSKNVAIRELVQTGLSEDDAYKYVQDAEAGIKREESELKHYREQAKKDILKAGGLLAVGVVIAVVSGGSYIPYAIVIGGIGLVFCVAAWLVYTELPDLALWIHHNRVISAVVVIMVLLIAVGVIYMWPTQ
jgi:hypothetical protein